MNNKQIIITNQDSKLTLQKSKNLFDITKKVLLNNHDWTYKLFEWFENNIIQERTIYPKTRTELLELTQISLKWNRLKDIPSEFTNLKKLELLELNNNAIETLPDSIENLTSLKHLNLNINSLLTLPKGIVKLKQLEYLNIKNNKYLELTEEQIKWLQSLKNNSCEIIYDKYKFNLGV